MEFLWIRDQIVVFVTNYDKINIVTNCFEIEYICAENHMKVQLYSIGDIILFRLHSSDTLEMQVEVLISITIYLNCNMKLQAESEIHILQCSFQLLAQFEHYLQAPVHRRKLRFGSLSSASNHFKFQTFPLHLL